MSKQVLVVGAGIVGASLAWHLTKAGCSVTVLDADAGGGLATRASFAWINASWGNPEFYYHFRRRSMDGWRRLEREVKGLSPYWCGSLMWELPPAELAAYAEEHGRRGYRMRWVDQAKALRIEPNLKAPPERALHIFEEGMVEPVVAAHALLTGAMARGARFLEWTRAASLLVRNDRVTGVITEAGQSVKADETVIACGADTARLLETAGVHLKMSAPAGLIMHSTVAQRRLLRGLVMAPGLHMRQTSDRRIIVGTDFAGGDPQGRDSEMARDLLGRLRGMLAGAENLEVGFVTVGHRPTPADGFPAIGRVRDGLYVTLLHSGITLAPVVGELAAREIATADRDHDLSPYDPGRAALAQGSVSSH